MKEETNATLAIKLLSAFSDQRLCSGQLLSGAEVAQRLSKRHTGIPQDLTERWTLCGRYSKDFGALLKDRSTAPSVSVQILQSSSGLHLAALSHRLQHHEHHLLFPLVGPQVTRFVHDIERQPVMCAMAESHEPDAQTIFSVWEAPQSVARELQARCSTASTYDAAECVLALLSLAQHALHPGELLSIAGEPVAKASSVTLVWPPELTDELQETEYHSHVDPSSLPEASRQFH